MKNLVEDVLIKAVTKVGKGAIRRGFEEIEATEETKPGIVAKG